jgi:hypothetical protein
MKVSHLLQVLNANGRAGADATTLTRGQKLDPLQASASKETPVYAGTPAVGAPAAAPSARNIKAEVLSDDWGSQLDQLSKLTTIGVAQSSATLRSAYETALGKLSPALRQKDWSFSVSHGQLVFRAGNDPLSAQDRTDLQNAFAATGAARAATEVANTVIATIQVQSHMGEEFGVDPGTGKYDVNPNNFANIVNLRSYLMAFAPGGQYYLNHRPGTSDSYFFGWYAMQDQVEQKAPLHYSQT